MSQKRDLRTTGFRERPPPTVPLLPLGCALPPLLERQRAPHRRPRHPPPHQTLGFEGSDL